MQLIRSIMTSGARTKSQFKMNAQSIVPWLKANYMILLPSFLNILASKIPTKADYDWAKKLKRPW